MEPLKYEGDWSADGIQELSRKTGVKRSSYTDKWDKYEELSDGENAKVYRMRLKSYPHTAAVMKHFDERVPKQAKALAEAKAAFAHEVLINIRLSDAGVAPAVYEYGIDSISDRFYLISEDAGETLEVLNKRLRKVETPILESLASAVIKMAELGVVHNDIHVENVMVKDDKVFVIDYGNATVGHEPVIKVLLDAWDLLCLSGGITIHNNRVPDFKRVATILGRVLGQQQEFVRRTEERMRIRGQAKAFTALPLTTRLALVE